MVPTLQERALFRGTWQCFEFNVTQSGGRGRVWPGLRHPDSARGYTPPAFLLHPGLAKVDLRLAGGPPSDPSFRFVFRFLLVVDCLLSFPFQFLFLVFLILSFPFLSFLLFLLPLATEPEHLERSNTAGELVGSPASVTLPIYSLLFPLGLVPGTRWSLSSISPFLRLPNLPRWYRRLCPCRRHRGSPPSKAVASNGAFFPFLDIGVAYNLVLAPCCCSPTNHTRHRLHSLAHRPLEQCQPIFQQAGGPTPARKPL